jgi:hypothetical protein
LKLNAILTENVVGKYGDLGDFAYTLGGNSDVFDLALSAANLVAAGTVARGDFVLRIDGRNGDDKISTAIYKDGNESSLADASQGAAAWYTNAHANLEIDAGAGNDTINTFGSGDWIVKLGAGSDTYYADNAADDGKATGKAVWVFNTKNQDNPADAARTLDKLQSGDNGRYISVDDNRDDATTNNGYGASAGELAGLYGLKLRVVFADVSGSANALPDTEGQGVYISGPVDVAKDQYIVTDRDINQAIKEAIEADAVLSKLLVATTGPGDTLVVKALSDGKHVGADLQIEFAIPTEIGNANVAKWNEAIEAVGWTAENLVKGRNDAFDTLLGATPTTTAGGIDATASVLDDYGVNAGGKYTGWYVSEAGGSYLSAFANTGGADSDLAGVNSLHTAENTVIVDGESGDRDVIVLSTGDASSDVIRWDGSYNNGTTTVVNFDTAAAGPKTAAEFVLDFTVIKDTTTANDDWDEVANDSAKLHFDFDNVGGKSGRVTVTLHSAKASNDADYVGGEFAAAFNAVFKASTGFEAVNASGVVTVTHATAGLGVTVAQPFITDGTNLEATSLTNLADLENSFDFTPATTSTLGDDWLDFTAYQARALFVATLDTDNKLVSGNTWYQVTDAADGTMTVDNGKTLATGITVITTGDYAWGDNKLKAGDKYITLTRENSAEHGEANGNRNTEYKVELWTLAGNKADAYLALPGGDTADSNGSPQLIGYVDLGKQIEGYADATSVLAHIDFIA